MTKRGIEKKQDSQSSLNTLRKIEDKVVYSFNYKDQNGDVLASYWPTLRQAVSGKRKLEESGYTVSKISKR